MTKNDLKKKKLTRAEFLRLTLPVLIGLPAIDLTATAAMLSNSTTLNSLYPGKSLQLTSKAAGIGNYYPDNYTSQSDVLSDALNTAEEISEAGFVLLKNRAGLLPLPKETPISPFGLRYAAPIYSGSGSAAIDRTADFLISPSEALKDSFPNYNQVLSDRLLQIGSTSPEDCPDTVSCAPLRAHSDGTVLYEYSSSVYDGMKESCIGNTALVFFGRIVGEMCDVCTSEYDDGTAHMLCLTSAEKETLRLARAWCEHVIVVLECSSPMQIPELEADDRIDAILWTGYPGSRGYRSLYRILTGAVCPSGRLPDVWPADFTGHPSFPNQDDGSDSFVYSNAVTTRVTRVEWNTEWPVPFHEYEEGIYVGYRYYETASDTGFLTDYYDSEKGVLYPFGYGLSYTSFSQELLACRTEDGSVSADVRVTNTGSCSGREVVQLYYAAPYTQLDQDLQIEKASANLAAFAKTESLAPGESCELSFSFAAEKMASYCFTHENKDGSRGSYVLEEGSYEISLRKNSHEVIDSFSYQQPETIWYEADQPRKSEQDGQSELDKEGGYLTPDTVVPAVNRFEELNSYMTDSSVSHARCLSRRDFAGTWPEGPGEEDRLASSSVLEWIREADTLSFDQENDPVLGSSPESQFYTEDIPVFGEENGLTLSDLRGVNYSDPSWDLLLNELDPGDFSSLEDCLFRAGYGIKAISSLGKPGSREYDGPYGLTYTDDSGHNWLGDTCGYPSEPVMAASWDEDLIRRFGQMIGEEAALADVNGWYAPGLMLHHSPFGGRVSEYFSEDPYLSGRMGSAVLSGAGNAGLYCSVKHLGVVDMETHKSVGTCTWMTEQALREMYLKPFEIALKSSRKTISYLDPSGQMKTRVMRAGDFLMADNAAIGARWCAADPSLLTDLLRKEWGFQGMVISDLTNNGNDARTACMLRAGCDMILSNENAVCDFNLSDTESAVSLNALRRAVRDISYVQANSRLMQGLAPDSEILFSLTFWQAGLIAANCITIAVIAVLLFLLAGSPEEEELL